MNIHVTVEKSAAALITTPAASKFYQSSGPAAKLTQRLTVHGDLEWLPNENIYFPGTSAQVNTRIHLSGQARFLGWEISCAGRPSSGHSFDHGHVEQRLSIARGHNLILHERMFLDGSKEPRRAAYGWQGKPVWATLICVAHQAARLVNEVRPATSDFEGLSAVSAPPTVDDALLIVRVLGDSAERARGLFERLYQILRPKILGKSVVRPRIWDT